jgi:hypothetical protein
LPDRGDALGRLRRLPRHRGSDTVNEKQNTKGQELIDLKRALEKGAIDQEGDKEEKRDILNRD